MMSRKGFRKWAERAAWTLRTHLPGAVPATALLCTCHPGRLAACHPGRSAACVAAAPLQAGTDAPEVDAAEPLQHTLHCLWRVERLRVDKGVTIPSGWTC